LKTENNFGLLI